MQLQPSKTTSTLEFLLQQWKSFGLDSIRSTLDSQASMIADNQDTSLESRKKLAEATKKFRALPGDAKLKNFGGLLKNYQEEVDRLTLRSTSAEKSFLSLYKSLSEIPDPVSGLTKALEDSQQSSRLSELEMENRRLQKELEEFHKEFQEIQNQEVTIRRLEEKIRDYETQMDELIADKIKISERQMQEDHAKEMGVLQERELELQRQLTLTRQELIAVRHAYEETQAQLYDFKTRHDDEQAAKQAQVELLVNELERANSAIATLERERDKLKEQAEEHAGVGAMACAAELEAAITTRDIEISRLQQQVVQLEQNFAQTVENHTTHTASLHQQIHAQTAQLQNLQQQLASHPTPSDLHEMRKQLEILKSMEPELGETEVISEKTVLKMLKDKNRRLETENIQQKGRVAELEQEVGGLTKDLASMREKVTAQATLITKLEDDVSRAGTTSESAAPFSNDDSMSSIGDVGMMSIVCSQRDRFKSRAAALEAESTKLQQQQQQLQEQITTLRHDNLKLYEKIRYLQSYNHSRPVSFPSSSTDIEDPYQQKYKKIYEESVNPFTLFSNKERQERLREMNTAERVALRTGRFFLANKYSRTFIFFYALALHLLVFLTLYKLAHSSTTTLPS